MQDRHDSMAMRVRLEELRAENPHMYPRDYAAVLGITEAELTPLFYGGRAQQLHNPAAVLASLSHLPRVKLMARVSYAVLEMFSRVNFSLKKGLLVSEAGSCYVALSPTEIGNMFYLSPEKVGDNAAILLFARQGCAALKLYIASHEFDSALLNQQAAAFIASEVTTAAALGDIRQEFLGDFATPTGVAADAPRRLIESAAAHGSQLAFELVTAAVAVFIRHAPQKVIDARGWFNVLDADFNLHLKEDAVVRIMGTRDAHRQMLQLENAAGETITIYSKGSK